MGHPNEDIVRRGYAAFAAGDRDALRELLAPDVTWHVPGAGSLAGTYKGADDVLGMFARLAERTDGTYRADLHDVAGNDEHVFSAHVASGRRGKKALRAAGVVVFHVRDGRVSEAWEASGDQHMVDDFWS